jgi:chromate transporter
MGEKPRVSLGEIFKTFLVIGATGFGGGMAVVSLVERSCVHEKGWLTRDEFMHGLAFGQILGPFSLNICTFVGCYLRGAVGGLVASASFIFPSFTLISLLTWLYFRFHEIPQLGSALKGTNPVVIALILVAVAGMTRAKVKGLNGWGIALIAFAGAAFLKANSLAILVAGAVWSLARYYYLREHR